MALICRRRRRPAASRQLVSVPISNCTTAPRLRSDIMTLWADARFDVIGAPYSMLSVSLSASQNLYTRRGTLVGLSGKADNVCA